MSEVVDRIWVPRWVMSRLKGADPVGLVSGVPVVTSIWMRNDRIAYECTETDTGKKYVRTVLVEDATAPPPAH